MYNKIPNQFVLDASVIYASWIQLPSARMDNISIWIAIQKSGRFPPHRPDCFMAAG
jgi:hypothetical protein